MPAQTLPIIMVSVCNHVHKLNFGYCYGKPYLTGGLYLRVGELGMRRTTIVILCVIILSVVMAGPIVGGQVTSSGSLQTGPYIDEVRFKVIQNDTLMRQQLIDGGIEMSNSFIDPFNLSDIQTESDIELFSQPRNGYELIVMNCLAAPMNWSGFRRAFAYAYDKTRAITEVYGGYGIAHDSLVPKVNRFCIEDDLPYHYYSARPDIGNKILDDLNFSIDPETGYRLDPNGYPIYIVIESWDSQRAAAAMIGVDALTTLHIAAETHILPYNYIINNLRSHWGYDMIVSEIDFYDDKVEWLAYEYWSENALVDFENLPGFRNETYDSWREQLIHGETFDEVYEAAAEMQKILHHNVPILVTCENLYIQGYRTDEYEGHVEDQLRYISGPWTMRNINAIDGSMGGSVTIGIDADPRLFGFNVFRYYDSYWSRSLRSMMELQYSSLFDYGPDMLPIPDLARNWSVETHSDDALIPEENIRYTFDIIQNATWSDGVPLTAKDVVFTLLYMRLMEPEFEFFKIKRHWSYDHLKAAYSPTPHRVVFEYNTKSYWLFSVFAHMRVVPEHIFSNETFASQWDWNDWDPIFNSKHPLLTSGPFVYNGHSESVEGENSFEYYNFAANPNYYFSPPRAQTPTTTTPTSTTLGNGLTPEMTIAITFCSILVIVVFVGEYIRSGGERRA